jgi:glycosyltransferase involved in cell wall biosynthesis
MLEQAGCGCELRQVRIGAAGKLRRTIALTDLVEALAARRACAGVRAPRIIFSSVTAALAQRMRVPYAVRFDTVAAQSRPGAMGAWQRRREPHVLARARLLLPWSEAAAQAAQAVVEQVTADHAPKMITLPVPIERRSGAAARDLDAIAYAANPPKRGLDLLCEAWRRVAPPGGRLIVGGIDRDRALRWLHDAGVQEPPGVEWAGDLTRAEWLERVGRARVFINASRYEDWGIAQLEALSCGTPLVTVPSSGPFEALALARRLAPELVAPELSAPALSVAIGVALAIGDAGRARYEAAADAMLEPYRPEAVRRTLTEQVVPALLSSSA